MLFSFDLKSTEIVSDEYVRCFRSPLNELYSFSPE